MFEFIVLRELYEESKHPTKDQIRDAINNERIHHEMRMSEMDATLEQVKKVALETRLRPTKGALGGGMEERGHCADCPIMKALEFYSAVDPAHAVFVIQPVFVGYVNGMWPEYEAQTVDRGERARQALIAVYPAEAEG